MNIAIINVYYHRSLNFLVSIIIFGCSITTIRISNNLKLKWELAKFANLTEESREIT